MRRILALNSSIDLRALRAEPLRPLRTAVALGAEAFALVRQASLLPRDLAVHAPGLTRPNDDVVILLHGLFATAGCLRPIRASLEQQAAAHTASFTYPSGPGIQDIAARLAEFVRGLPRDVRLHLVGHSVGGVVARWFVQELGGDPRIVQTISIASPFRGTRHARLIPGQACRDITPQSELLERLRAGGRRGPRLPHLSIVAGLDSVVTESTTFSAGEVIVVDRCGHHGILFHPAVAHAIVERVKRPLSKVTSRHVSSAATVRTSIRPNGATLQPPGEGRADSTADVSS